MEFCGIFIKFGTKEHLLKLQKDGLLHCRPLNYFKDIEDNNLRGDKFETVVELIYIKNPLLQIKPASDPSAEYKSIPITKAQIVYYRTDDFGNLFCLHAINVLEKEEGEIFSIDKRNKKFGDHFLMITDTSEFIERLQKSLLENNLNYEHDLVKYFELAKYKGKKTVFNKDMIYEYQKEFRLFIHNTTNQIIEFKIGDLSDISVLYPSTIADTLIMKR